MAVDAEHTHPASLLPTMSDDDTGSADAPWYSLSFDGTSGAVEVHGHHRRRGPRRRTGEQGVDDDHDDDETNVVHASDSSGGGMPRYRNGRWHLDYYRAQTRRDVPIEVFLAETIKMANEALKLPVDDWDAIAAQNGDAARTRGQLTALRDRAIPMLRQHQPHVWWNSDFLDRLLPAVLTDRAEPWLSGFARRHPEVEARFRTYALEEAQLTGKVLVYQELSADGRAHTALRLVPVATATDNKAVADVLQRLQQQSDRLGVQVALDADKQYWRVTVPVLRVLVLLDDPDEGKPLPVAWAGAPAMDGDRIYWRHHLTPTDRARLLDPSGFGLAPRAVDQLVARVRASYERDGLCVASYEDKGALGMATPQVKSLEPFELKLNQPQSAVPAVTLFGADARADVGYYYWWRAGLRSLRQTLDQRNAQLHSDGGGGGAATRPQPMDLSGDDEKKSSSSSSSSAAEAPGRLPPLEDVGMRRPDDSFIDPDKRRQLVDELRGLEAIQAFPGALGLVLSAANGGSAPAADPKQTLRSLIETKTKELRGGTDPFETLSKRLWEARVRTDNRPPATLEQLCQLRPEDDLASRLNALLTSDDEWSRYLARAPGAEQKAPPPPAAAQPVQPEKRQRVDAPQPPQPKPAALLPQSAAAASFVDVASVMKSLLSDVSLPDPAAVPTAAASKPADEPPVAQPTVRRNNRRTAAAPASVPAWAPSSTVASLLPQAAALPARQAAVPMAAAVPAPMAATVASPPAFAAAASQSTAEPVLDSSAEDAVEPSYL